MKNLLRILLLVVVLGAGWGIWQWMHPSPEKAIRQQLAKLSDSLVSKPNEGNIARVTAVNRALSFFAPDVVINGEGMSRFGETIQGRTELQQAIFAARRQLEGDINFSDVHVQVAGETNATATFTAIGRLAGQSEPYTQDIKAQFQNIDGKWLIARVDPIALPPPKRAE